MPLVRRGFYEAILSVLRLRADGLMTLGPPCGSFVWISSSSHGWGEHKPYGLEDKEWVNIGSMSLAQNEVGVVTNTCCFMNCFMKYLEDHPISKWLVSWVIYHQ
jgi:hypothetical protein